MKKVNAPKFVYITACCNTTATKGACVRTAGKKEFEEMPLGKWRCSACGKRAKVSRQVNA